jgi:hypothetical protein
MIDMQNINYAYLGITICSMILILTLFTVIVNSIVKKQIDKIRTEIKSEIKTNLPKLSSILKV